GTPGSEEDSQRPLTGKGSKRMEKIVRGLRQIGVELDMILTSPYVRARATAEILASEFKMKDKVAFTDNLIPPGNFDLLIDEITEKYNVNSLALVGHEPMLSRLISFLTTGNTETKITLKKGGVGLLSADDLRQERRAALQWLLTPAIMVKLSN
ncbi:MAG TPA: phosphohistidine phosphatase SixA, partial [Anaerolineales bacterium]|nr:phosphohistidine phosphatase SixA [Anaerolineales bacterium]